MTIHLLSHKVGLPLFHVKARLRRHYGTAILIIVYRDRAAFVAATNVPAIEQIA